MHFTTFRKSLRLNKRGSSHRSDAASSLSAVVPEIPLDPASVYLKAHRSMLMRHMHMGIIMDIMVFCFILRFSSPH